MQSDRLVDAAHRHAHYLSKAQEAVEMAAKCHEPEARLTWLELAASWRYLAEQTAGYFTP